MLLGNTSERKELWKARFSVADDPKAISDESWTYQDLATLIKTLKTVAKKKYGLEDIMVGT